MRGITGGVSEATLSCKGETVFKMRGSSSGVAIAVKTLPVEYEVHPLIPKIEIKTSEPSSMGQIRTLRGDTAGIILPQKVLYPLDLIEIDS
jgi:hypothetical protein